MPKNQRPGMLSIGWQGKSISEIEDAQNTYDLLETQEKLLEETKRLQEQQKEAAREAISYNKPDYAILTGVDRTEFNELVNNVNESVINETPNIVQIAKQEKEFKFLLSSNENGRSISRILVGTLLPFILIFVGVLCAFLYFGRGLDTGISVLLTIATIIGTIVLCFYLASVYNKYRYGTKEQDEKNLENLINSKVMSPTYKKFRQYRLKHYNNYMEQLLREYLAPSIKDYYDDGIGLDEVHGYGTPKDYMNYLRENFSNK